MGAKYIKGRRGDKMAQMMGDYYDTSQAHIQYLTTHLIALSDECKRLRGTIADMMDSRKQPEI